MKSKKSYEDDIYILKRRIRDLEDIKDRTEKALGIITRDYLLETTFTPVLERLYEMHLRTDIDKKTQKILDYINNGEIK
jgi:hypothetical protein